MVPANYTTNTPAHSVAQVIRLLPSGAIDSSFGNNGMYSFGKDTGIGSMALLADGSVLVGLDGQDVRVAKLKQDGSLDAGFGIGGFSTVSLSTSPGGEYAHALLADGNDGFLIMASAPSYKVSIVPVGASGVQATAAFEVVAASTSSSLAAFIDTPSKQIVLAVPTWASNGLEVVGVSYAAPVLPPVVVAPLVRGSAGSDQFVDTVAQDSFDGGAGIDHLSYGGARAKYVVSRVDRRLVVENPATGTKDSLTSVERMHFADVSLGFDSDGFGGQAFRIYQAAFKRPPNAAGLGYWINALERGTSLNEVARLFTESLEYLAMYKGLDHQQLIGKYYANILGRAPEAGATAFWAGVLDSGRASEAEVLAAISESAENRAAVIGAIEPGFAYTLFG